MKRRWIIRPYVEDEIEEIAAWYDDRRPGLGDEFVDAITAAYADINLFPESGEAIEQEIRHHVLQRFPYAIYYAFLTDAVEVLKVVHHSRGDRVRNEKLDR